MEDMKYRGSSITLEEGDKIFQYTDGVTEATNISNELYGRERLNAVLNENYTKAPCEILEAVKKNIDVFAGEADQFDDITMLCLEYKKKMGAMQKLVVKAVAESIPTVTDFVDKILEEHFCDMKAKMQIDIAIDEILANISQYAYETDEGDVSVSVQIMEAPKRAIITFEDTGVPYNPITTEEPDTTLSADERQIGGLGIFMVKKTMDDMAYEYKNNCNVLRITKNI